MSTKLKPLPPRILLLTPGEAATELRSTESTLAKWRSARKGPPWLKIVGGVRYEAETLRRWIESQIREGDYATTETVRDVKLPRFGKGDFLQRPHRSSGYKTKRERNEENQMREFIEKGGQGKS